MVIRYSYSKIIDNLNFLPLPHFGRSISTVNSVAGVFSCLCLNKYVYIQHPGTKTWFYERTNYNQQPFDKKELVKESVLYTLLIIAIFLNIYKYNFLKVVFLEKVRYYLKRYLLQ